MILEVLLVVTVLPLFMVGTTFALIRSFIAVKEALNTVSATLIYPAFPLGC